MFQGIAASHTKYSRMHLINFKFGACYAIYVNAHLMAFLVSEFNIWNYQCVYGNFLVFTKIYKICNFMNVFSLLDFLNINNS